MPDPIEKDACDLLDADHLAVKHLFVEYARCAYAPDEPGAAGRAAIAAKICNEIDMHARIEEEMFYPALRGAVAGAADVLDEATREHGRAKELVAAIRALAAADAQMDQLVAELACAIEHHVKEERDELFPKARTAPGLDLPALGVQLRQRQQELAQRSEAASSA